VSFVTALAFAGIVVAAAPLAAQPAPQAATPAEAAAFADAERARAAGLAAIFADAPVAAGRVLPPVPALDTLRAQIEPHHALLVYALAEPATALWVVTRARATRVDLPGAAEITAHIDTLRRNLERPDRARSKEAQHAARRLYMMLVSSAEPLLGGITDLAIVPDGALHLLPFEALLATEPDGKGRVPKRGYLVERYDVSYALSAAAAAAPRSPGRRGGVVALGDPLFEIAGEPHAGPSLEALPNTAAELASLDLQARGREMRTLVGADATRAALLGDPLLADAAVIHLATHAIALDEEPLRSGLWLASDGTTGPGFVSVRDLLVLDLRAGLVTLSACEMAAVGPGAGNGVRAFTQGFAEAGVPRVVLTQWKVGQRATALLLERFYRDVLRKDRPAAAALSEAKRQMIRKSETSSPHLWAPFVLYRGVERVSG
jgi:CHAT domain-containing protein